jgi:hypothetical protein
LKVFDATDDSGDLVYFEVSNSLLSRHAAHKLVRDIPGTAVLTRPRRFAFFGDDVFCTFKLGDKEFIIWEPFGDNSRFHISTSPAAPCPELHLVRAQFLRYQPLVGYLPWLVLAAAMAGLVVLILT